VIPFQGEQKGTKFINLLDLMDEIDKIQCLCLLAMVVSPEIIPPQLGFQLYFQTARFGEIPRMRRLDGKRDGTMWVAAQESGYLTGKQG
jgi:hypothetical protein